MKIVMDKFVFDSGHDYEYAFYINDQLIIATNDDNFGLDCVFAASNYIHSKPRSTLFPYTTLFRSVVK